MAMTGRKPVPPEIRALTGLKSSHPPPNPSPQKIKRPLGGPPSWMNALQKEIWKEGLVSAPRCILREIDSAIYQVFVFAAYSARRASEAYERSGASPVLVSPNGKLYQNPYLAIIRAEHQVMKGAATEMGFTPSSRMRVKDDGDKEEKPDNPFNEFANGQSTKPQGKKPN